MVALVLLALFGAGAVAEPQDRPESSDVVVTAPRSCARNGALPDLACLNAELEREARGPISTKLDSASDQRRQAPSRIGTYSAAATRQRMGRGFGKGAFAVRPPRPSFPPNPILPSRASAPRVAEPVTPALRNN